MIPQEIVDRIFDSIDIVEVIGDYVELEKKGVNYLGKCPFHDEKSPSFTVHREKKFYKCFGCGKSGNAVGFLMDKNKISYPEALKVLAKKYGISIPRQEITDEQKAIWKGKEQLHVIYNLADNYYHSQLQNNEAIASFLKQRNIPDETVSNFHLGFAPQFNSFLSYAKQQGLIEEFLLKSALVKEGKSGLYDFFYNRLVFPIHSPSGRVIAFGGRLISGQGPKYLNSSETDIYNKSETLYGFFQARESIQANDQCYIVEGYTDVLRLYSIGVKNVVAPCGTSLTFEQISLIKRYTDQFVLIYDGDQAGERATQTNAEQIVKAGCIAKVVLLPKQKFDFEKIEDHPENCDSSSLKKIDPDSFYKSHSQFIEYNGRNTFDYILLFAERILKNATGPDKQHHAIKRICELLGHVNQMIRKLYIEQISKTFKIKIKVLTDYIKDSEIEQIHEELAVIDKLPSHIDVKEYEKTGFYEDNNCYYFSTRYGPMKGSNFVIKPLFHVYSKSDNKRLIEIINESGYKRIVDVQSKSFVSFDQFQQKIFEEGNYLFFANKPAFYKILNKISDRFAYCNELKTMGWQREGFFSFANGYFCDKWVPTDEYGIIEFKNQKYFSPAFSVIYKDVREDDDEYENDRFFVYKEPPINFSTWCKIIVKVYQENGVIGIAYVLSTLFRDIIYKKFKFFPHLFLFAQPQSGKTTFGYSLSNVFFQELAPFNLSAGTNVGFFRRLARFRNTISWFDEYSNDIDPKRFEALKSAYDGVGHEKGKMTKDNRSEITKVISGCIISGQHLPTINDSSLMQRSILLTFKTRGENNPFTSEEAEALMDLKSLESKGISGIILELLKYRPQVEKHYSDVFSSVYSDFKNYFTEQNRNYSERLLMNFACIVSTVKLFKEYAYDIDFGFDFEEFYDLAKKSIEDLSQKVTQSDYLASFWNLLSYMLETKQIEIGIDFLVKDVRSLIIRTSRTESKPIGFPNGKKILLLRLAKIHPLYLELYRKQFGHTGVQLSSLIHYLSNHRAYLGNVKTVSFENSKTSAFAFDYDLIDINLERDIPGVNSSDSDDLNVNFELLGKEETNYLPF
jgi:DNA primase catalytic core